MTRRDKILFSFPAVAALVIFVFAGLLCWYASHFARLNMESNEENLILKTELAAGVLTQMLDSGRVDDARAFCNRFGRDILRLTLIDESGNVTADSFEDASFLDNHHARDEVKAALGGHPEAAFRYSASLNRWMLYYALPLQTQSGFFVLRAALAADRVTRLIGVLQITMMLAVILGGMLVLLLTLYIVDRVRRPLQALQSSVGEIAAGNLDAPLAVPPSGMLHELASGVAEMTVQLRTRLNEVTVERNEKEAILNAMGEAVMLFSAGGDLLKCNRAASLLFDAVPGDGFTLARSGIPGLLPQVREMLQSRKSFEKEFEFASGDVIRILLVRGRVLNSDSGKQAILTIADMTDLYKLESFRSDFVANVSHELKTPLTSICGGAEILKDWQEISEDQVRQLAGMIYEQSCRLAALVSDILSLAALERKQHDSDQTFAFASLDAMLVNAVNLCRDRAGKAGISLEIGICDPVGALCDFQLMEQAVVNLVMNAIQYSESAVVTASLTREKDSAVIEVKDRGVGIPPQHRERIFERFYRVHRERSRQSGGTGLGLAIVKHIAQLHGGSVRLLETPGGGCTFRLTIPVAD